MNRRMILLAAAVATASPALSQTASQSQMGEAEKTHAEKTAAIGGASLQMADIAMQKATRPKVRDAPNSNTTSKPRWLRSSNRWTDLKSTRAAAGRGRSS